VNLFLSATSRAIARHGVDCTYTSFVQGAYDPETGSATKTETNTQIKAYPKQEISNQYHYPNLIGKEIVRFYLLAGTIVPKINDYITLNSVRYTIDNFQSHQASGEIILYRIVAVKG
jgi:hypothetical protein